jgi:hypothetical protein
MTKQPSGMLELAAAVLYGVSDRTPPTPESLLQRHQQLLTSLRASTSSSGVTFDQSMACAERPNPACCCDCFSYCWFTSNHPALRTFAKREKYAIRKRLLFE